MWSWISCYLIGHDYGIHCEAGAIYLRCETCGRRSNGWNLHRDQADGVHDHGNGAQHAPALASFRQH